MNSNNQTKIVFLLAINLFYFRLIAQNSEPKKEKNDSSLYKNSEVVDSCLKSYQTTLHDSLSIGELNVFMNKKLANYLSEVSDVSTSPAYAVLDNKDEKLFIGGTFRNRKKLNDFSRFLYTVGIRANIKKGFSEFFNKDGVNNDIGFNGKIIYQIKGSIDCKNISIEDRFKLNAKHRIIRDNNLQKLDTDISSFRKETQNKDSIQKFVKEKITSADDTFDEESADFIIKNKLFKHYNKIYFTGDLYIPFTKSEYNIVSNLKSTDIKKEPYFPFDIKLTGSYLNEWVLKGNKKNSITLLCTVFTSFSKNDSIRAALVDPISYESFINQSIKPDSSYLAKIKSESVYFVNAKSFDTYKIGCRFVGLWNGWIGISASLEKSNGLLNTWNWRLGIPFSLKNKDGENKINFELIWQEINKKHSLGISVGLPFGNSIF